MEENTNATIKVGQYIIVQRQKYRKIHLFSSEKSILSLGKDQVELSSIVGKNYASTFKMVRKVSKKNRIFILEYVPDTILTLKAEVAIKTSGVDNRNILDDGKSQKLTIDEITALRGSQTSTGIVETLITNSNTFHSKTEYSQQKYLKKKEKKYFEYIQILKPTVRIVAEIMHRQNSENIMDLRIDTLSQILSYSNVQGMGNFLLYETGTNGLLPAALLNAIGCNTNASLIHLHPGSQYQEKGILMMNFPKEQREKCKSVNVYSILRYYYQFYNKDTESLKDLPEMKPVVVSESSSRKRPLSNGSVDDDNIKVIKICNDQPTDVKSETKENAEFKIQAQSDIICNILNNKLDCLIIAVREHPLPIFKMLYQFLHYGRPFVIYSNLLEPLKDCYMALSLRKDVTNLHLYTNWMRDYQILENRTHPELQMNVNSGYLLTGFTIQADVNDK